MGRTILSGKKVDFCGSDLFRGLIRCFLITWLGRVRTTFMMSIMGCFWNSILVLVSKETCRGCFLETMNFEHLFGA